MTIAAIMQEAKSLEEQLWNVANNLGVKRTNDGARTLKQIISGKIGAEAKARGYQDVVATEEDILAYESANTDMRLLAGCFMCVSLVLDHGEGSEDEWGMLCEACKVIGLLEATTGLGDIQSSLSQIYSRLGVKGAAKRYEPMATLRSWAIEKYQGGEWQSANQAAHTLKESILKHGRTINAHLSEENAQRTIAEWFRKSV